MRVSASRGLLCGGGLLQSRNLFKVLKHDSGRDPAALPVVHALLISRLLIEPEEARKRGVAACGGDDQGGLFRVHGAIKHHVYL